MASPTHKDNLLNSKYKEMGIAVVEGTLNGQQTTLVVQMFGTAGTPPTTAKVAVADQQIDIPKEEVASKPAVVAAVTNPPPNNTLVNTTPPALIDPYIFYKSAGLTLIGFLTILLSVDLIVLYRRGIFRLSSHHVAHMSLLGLTAGSLFMSSPGAIL